MLVVTVLPDGLPAAPISRRAISVVRGAEPAAADELGPDAGLLDELPDGLDDEVRDVVPADGTPAGELPPEDDAAPHRSAYDDEIDPDTQDTVVLGRLGDDDEDPRARIPAWEDIVFGVRRHR